MGPTTSSSTQTSLGNISVPPTTTLHDFHFKTSFQPSWLNPTMNISSSSTLIPTLISLKTFSSFPTTYPLTDQSARPLASPQNKISSKYSTFSSSHPVYSERNKTSVYPSQTST